MHRDPFPLHVLVVVVFLGSLLMPALVVDSKPLLGGGEWREKTFWGIHCLAFGFFVLPGWLANPFLLVGVVLHALRAKTAAIFVMTLAVISALIAPFMLSEVDTTMRLVRVQVGYVAWVASMFLMLVVTIRGRVDSSGDLHATR
jgi:hypothetical protein